MSVNNLVSLLEDTAHSALEWFRVVYFRPRAWPRWLRRVYVVTLPVSWPLWVLSIALLWRVWIIGCITYVAGMVVIVGPIVLIYWISISLYETLAGLWREPNRGRRP